MRWAIPVVFLCTILSMKPLLAADVNPIKAPIQPVVNSSSGWYVGGNVMATMGSSGSANDFSSLQTGGAVGGQIGYQYWLGSIFAAGEIFGDVDMLNRGPGLGYATTAKVGEIAKIGYGLGGLLGLAGKGVTAPSQSPVPVTAPAGLASSLSAPYAAFGAVESIGVGHAVAGWAAGAGYESVLSQNWTLDVMGLYIDYNDPITKNEWRVKLGLNYKM